MKNKSGSRDKTAGIRDEIIASRESGAISPFQCKVYLALLGIPHGKVVTYGALASRVGCASARAIGGAMKTNPFAPRVPCHRVVAAGGSIGGFCGFASGPEIARKIRLLKSEGVCVDHDGRIDLQRFGA